MPATNAISVPMVDEADVAVEALKFLSDGNRLRILRILSHRESCVCELIEQLDLPQPLVSYHLRRLREAGLVLPRRKAQWIYYSIEPAAWERFTRPIRHFCQIADLPPAAAYGASDTCDSKIPVAELGAIQDAGSPWVNE